MSTSISWRSELIAGVVALIISATLLATTWGDSYLNTGLGAAHSTVFYPRIILIVMTFTSLQITVTALLGRKRDNKTAKGSGQLVTKAAAITILCTIGYVMLLPQLGFLIVSILLTAVVGWAVGYRRWWILMSVAFSVPVALWLMTMYLLKIPLPAGTFL